MNTFRSLAARQLTTRRFYADIPVSTQPATSNTKRPLYWTGALVLGTVAYYYLSDSRSAIHEHVVMPIMHKMDPETSHKFAIWCAKYGLVPSEKRPPTSDLLKVSLWGKQLDNPLGLAAGFDKHADAIDSLFGFGFGMVEIGSVTPLPQDGNPKPRMFRLEKDKSVINRYGFNSEGHEAVYDKLQKRIRRYNCGVSTDLDRVSDATNMSLHNNRLFGVNLGKNKKSPEHSNDDYVNGVKRLGRFGDYLVVNISSPNTPGLRSLQRREAMESLLSEVKSARDQYCAERKTPLLVKIAPDLSDVEIQDIAATIMNVGIDGIIISNTTISRPSNLQSNPDVVKETGGLSGPPVKPLALNVVRQMYNLTQGKVPIIGCGGIASAEDALTFCKAGASAVQMYTSLGYYGPGLVANMKHDLVHLLEKEGKSWSELVGTASD